MLFCFSPRRSYRSTTAECKIASSLWMGITMETRGLASVMRLPVEVTTVEMRGEAWVISTKAPESRGAAGRFVQLRASCPPFIGQWSASWSRFESCFPINKGSGAVPLRTPAAAFENRYQFEYHSVVSNLTLGDVAPGTRVVVASVGGARAFRRRLMELGIIPGTQVEVLRVAPLGDPVELSARGCNLSIRRAEAKLVDVLEQSSSEREASKVPSDARLVKGLS